MRLFSSLLLSAALVLTAVPAGADSLTDEIKDTYEKITAFRADFQQRLVHQESGSEQKRNGTLLFKKPMRICWETFDPDPELLVVSDLAVWDFLPDEEIAYKYSPKIVSDSQTILNVITGQSRLDQDFAIENEPDENGMAVLRLYPKEPSTQMVEAVIWVDRSDKLLRKVQVMDFYGNINEVALSHIEPGAAISDDKFTFTPGQGIEVQDFSGEALPERQLLQ